MNRERFIALLALTVMLLSWGSMPLFLKYLTACVDAWTANGIRHGLAALILLPAHRKDKLPDSLALL